ncbi:MAG: hypothetical protein LVQ97_04410 [Candidatus Micrarchaeales archaeon]|jgi:hypothetical protein|nr:hypothetical protein [Candidatus Micrarchaeales archaeon]
MQTTENTYGHAAQARNEKLSSGIRRALGKAALLAGSALEGVSAYLMIRLDPHEIAAYNSNVTLPAQYMLGHPLQNDIAIGATIAGVPGIIALAAGLKMLLRKDDEEQ